MRKISKIYIHHSALPMDKDIEYIREFHIKQGYKDIGYHFVINANGEIQPGRPIEEEGAHTKGNNLNSIGICLCGNFEEYPPTKEQITALKNLIINLQKKFGKLDILGHKDFSHYTVCPGSYLYEILQKIKKGAL